VSLEQLRKPPVIIAVALVLMLWMLAWRGCSRDSRIMAHEDWVVVDMAVLMQKSAAGASLNNGGYVNPVLLAEPGYHPTWTLPRRFGEPVRYGYRFEFSGRRALPRVEGQYWHKPAYASFTYVALPLIPGKTGRRSFAIFPDDDPFAVHYREDGTPPTLQDPSIRTAEIQKRIPPEPFMPVPDLED
jgi:hypothetical protein